MVFHQFADKKNGVMDLKDISVSRGRMYVSLKKGGNEV